MSSRHEDFLQMYILFVYYASSGLIISKSKPAVPSKLHQGFNVFCSLTIQDILCIKQSSFNYQFFSDVFGFKVVLV